MSDVDSLDKNKLNALIDVSSKINSNYTNIDALLIYILESAMRLVECESSSLLLGNKENNNLHFAVALGPTGSEVKNIPVNMNSIAGWVITNNKHVLINNVQDDQRFFSKVQSKTGYVSRTMIAIPMRVNNNCIGVIELINKSEGREFDDNDLHLLEMLGTFAGVAYENAETYRLAQRRIAVLQTDLSIGRGYHQFIAKSSVMLDLMNMVERAAKQNASVLITGESGVGKELFAEQLHMRSNRHDKPFVRVNCAALSANLLESELFGHVKGAFTDAIADRKGRFEEANGGTLFLDEIGELSYDLQSKLLRAIQERTIERVGSNKPISVDIRIISATNKDLEKLMAEKKFRNDLYFRLNVIPLRIPPLRERPDDIFPLAEFFLQKFSSDTKKKFEGFTEDAKNILYEYHWPGNIRELENAIERACVLGSPPFINSDNFLIRNTISVDHPVVKTQKEKSESLLEESCEVIPEDLSLKFALNEFKKNYIVKLLERTKWNQTQAAKILDIQRTYLARLITELGIREKK